MTYYVRRPFPSDPRFARAPVDETGEHAAGAGHGPEGNGAPEQLPEGAFAALREEVDRLQAELERVTEERDQQKDARLRVAADFDNFRKRQARDREQRVALAPRDRDARVRLLDEPRPCPALEQHGLDLEADAAQVREVAPDGALARPDLARQLGEPASAAKPAQLVEDAQDARDMLQITSPIHV